MTPRFQLALAGLIALAVGTGLTWFLIGDNKPHDTEVDHGPDTPGSNGGSNDGGLLKGTPGTSTGTASSLTDSQIGAGLKEALSVGAERAVALLGRDGGFLNDKTVRIPLPGVLGSAAKAAAPVPAVLRNSRLSIVDSRP